MLYPNDTGRLRKVLEIAAEKSGWGKKKFAKGAGMGIAVHRSFLTYVANVVEVQVSDEGNDSHPSRRYGGGCRTHYQSRSSARPI